MDKMFVSDYKGRRMYYFFQTYEIHKTLLSISLKEKLNTIVKQNFKKQ